MRKGNGGIIGPQNRTTIAVAPGIWSMDEQQQSLGARNWPGTPAPTVPNAPSFANSSVFTASISSNVMTVTAISSGTLATGQVITDTDVLPYTTITSQLSGAIGSTGTYRVSLAQTVGSAELTATLSIASTVTATSSVVIPYTLGFNGGSPITGVTAKIFSGSTLVKTVSGASSPLTATLVPNSAVYTATLTATNAIGTSEASIGPYFKTPSVPDAPTIGTVTVSGVTASVPFTAPTNNNGNTITIFTATSSPGGITASSATSPISVPGLSSATTYTFTVYATNAVGNSLPSASSNSITTATTYNVDYLIVAGGGGGAGDNGGGGGAGGYLTSTSTLTPGVLYAVTVGLGGVGGSAARPSTGMTAGANSVFNSITATGGGTSTGFTGGATTGGAGGSGGGAAGPLGAAASTGGLGVSGQGNNGGSGYTNGTVFSGGGGGGAGVAGSNSVSFSPNGGPGGNGLQSSITGTATYYAGGGGGSTYTGGGGNAQSNGGLGGGGKGGGGNTLPSTVGLVNTGGGGGAGGYGSGPDGLSQAGATGGSGVVILSVPTASYSATTTGSPTITTSGANTIIKFTGIGSYTA